LSIKNANHILIFLCRLEKPLQISCLPLFPLSLFFFDQMNGNPLNPASFWVLIWQVVPAQKCPCVFWKGREIVASKKEQMFFRKKTKSFVCGKLLSGEK
jgi:hypothetical protein